MDARHEIARPRAAVRGAAFGALVCWILPSLVHAQPNGSVRGRVIDVDRRPIGSVTVTVEHAAIAGATDASGRFSLSGVPRGPRVLRFHRLGYAVHSVTITVAGDSADVGDVTLEIPSRALSAVVVEAVSHETDRMIDAPAAVDVVRPETAQMPPALTRVSGLDLAQTSAGDFAVNARGFNTTAVRKTEVVQDGRDLGLVVTGQQVWDALPGPADDVGRVEVIRGPASAMYGANAFNGVISITTPPVRDVIGTKVTVGGGDLRTRRVDFRNAGDWSNGTLGYRLNGGYDSNNDWTRSRTAKDLSDWAQEYATAGAPLPVGAMPESLPLAGQTKDPETGRAIGTPDPVMRLYGSARLDYYTDDGASVTVEGGSARVSNEINLARERAEISRVLRPWARLAWTTDGEELSAWYSGASASGVALGSAMPLHTNESAVHVEGRLHRMFDGDAGRVVAGISLQNNLLNTHDLVLDSADDARADQYYGAFGEAEYAIGRWHLLGAMRWDASGLFPIEISPKVAAVYMPAERHALHLTFDRAFLTPEVSSLFDKRPHGFVDLSAIETQLRSELGPALAAVPAGMLFDTSAKVAQLTVGNRRLVPQTVTTVEVGYKGDFANGAFLTFDAYYARNEQFITPSTGATLVNTDFQPWTAPKTIPEAERPAVESAVRTAVAALNPVYATGLTRGADETTEIVSSFGNAGVADEAGVELGASAPITKALTLSAAYSSIRFAIRSNPHNAVPSPNTPPNKGDVGLDYAGLHGLDVAVDARIVETYEWASGTLFGRIPASQFVDIRVRYPVSPRFRLYLEGSDVLDQRRFQILGGAVIGRRVVAGITSEF